MVMTNLFCFGFGYVAQRLTGYLKEWTVEGTSRQNPNHLLFTGQAPLDEAILKNYNSFLISIPPTENGDIVLQQHKDFFLRHKDQIHWIGYLSATSVYGDHQGNWVDEKSPTHPSSTSGRNRLLAEQQWLDLYKKAGLPIHIMRLSGIYGPERNVLTAIMRGNAPIIYKKDHVFSRIHVDDICQVLHSSLTTPNPGSIYNLADDEPASSADVMIYGYGLLNKTPPALIPFDQAQLSPMALDFYSDHKRINNSKIKEELGIILHYPHYRDGLKSCWHEHEAKTY